MAAGVVAVADELHAAPGNPGIAALATCHPVAADDAEGLLGLARSFAVDLVVVGPEAPLVAGVGGRAAALGDPRVRAIGGSRAHRGIEAVREGGDGRRRRADGGVAPDAARAVRAEGRRPRGREGRHRLPDRERARAPGSLPRGFEGDVLVEELLEGPEVSVFALCDGVDAVALAPARDYKRAFDGDDGPNTGGMGSFAPVAELDERGSRRAGRGRASDRSSRSSPTGDRRSSARCSSA